MSKPTLAQIVELNQLRDDFIHRKLNFRRKKDEERG